MPVQFSSVTQSCLILCNPMNCSARGLPVHHQLLEFTQTHVHQVGDTIQPSHPLSSPSPPALNLSQIMVFSNESTLSLSSFTFIKRLFNSSPSAIRVMSSAYLRLLIFLPEILILACASSSPAFLTMYSAYKLNKQCDNIQP